MTRSSNLKIVFLNTWDGKMRDNLARFITKQATDTEVFCLIETHPRMLKQARQLLRANYQEFLGHKIADRAKKDDGLEKFDLAVYVKNGINVVSSGVLMQEATNYGLAVYTLLQIGTQSIYVCGVHGISRPGDKLDTAGRLAQSQAIVDFFSGSSEPIIVGGDFNLQPETKSVTIFTEAGYKDLIKDFKIPATRNHLAWDRFPDSKQSFADYTFVSPDVEVVSFTVPDIDASDHLPMILEIK